MSARIEASVLIRKLAEPAPAGAHIETLIRGVARELGLSFGRAFRLWYRQARIVSSDEMDMLRAAEAAKRGVDVNEQRATYRELLARIESLERGLRRQREREMGAGQMVRLQIDDR